MSTLAIFMWKAWPLSIAFLAAAVMFTGCKGGKTIPGYSPARANEARQGREVIEQFSCGKCHTIPGIRDAKGVFGPPLMKFGRRTFIAGNFPNLPNILTRWIMAPQSMKPKTAMPTLGLTEAQARDAAAYLENLR
jgi:cytochrome c